MQIEARREFLHEKAADIVIQIWSAQGRYGEYVRQQAVADRALCADYIVQKKDELRKTLREMNNLSREPKEGDITPDMIRRAKEYPFEQLVELKHRSAMCPFHEGKTPALRYYPNNNTVHCFACAKTWDTIQWVMDTENVSFPEAVKKLS